MRETTGKNSASNYGVEDFIVNGGNSDIAVYENSDGGPYWTHPHKGLNRPEAGYILTKTHCGAYCYNCPPGGYIMNHFMFSNSCFEGNNMIKNTSSTAQDIQVLTTYNNDLLGRAVHLFREPMANIVARFHLAVDTDKDNIQPRTKEGFRSYCNEMDNKFYIQESQSKLYEYLSDDLANIPCYADVIRYILWHNLATITTDELDIPTMILHYEDYTNSFNQTKYNLLGFLGQEQVHEPPLFVTGKTYQDYFTSDEIQAVANLFKKVATKKTWQNTKHYFDHLRYDSDHSSKLTSLTTNEA